MNFKKLASLSLITACTFTAVVGCSSNENTLVSYNGGSITSDEMTQELNLNKLLNKILYNTDASDEEIKEEAEQLYITLSASEVFASEAKKQKITVSDTEVEDVMNTLKEIYKNKPGVEECVKKAGYTDEQIKEIIINTLLAEKFDIKMQKDIAISETEVENYYNENLTSKYTPKYAEASHIVIKTIDDEGNPLSDTDKKKAKEKVEEVLKKVQSGEDFATLAKEYCEDGTADDGGNLGKFYEGQMVKEFEDATFALEKGETSGIVETRFGYHIIKLKDKGKETLPYSNIASQVQSDLFDAKLNDQRAALLNKYHYTINKENITTYLKNIKLVDASKVLSETKAESTTSTNETKVDSDKDTTTKDKSNEDNTAKTEK